MLGYCCCPHSLLRTRAKSLPAAVVTLCNCRYSFEALLITEFHGADGYRFTAFHQPGAPPDQIPHIDVTGDQILQVMGHRLCCKSTLVQDNVSVNLPLLSRSLSPLLPVCADIWL